MADLPAACPDIWPASDGHKFILLFCADGGEKELRPGCGVNFRPSSWQSRVWAEDEKKRGGQGGRKTRGDQEAGGGKEGAAGKRMRRWEELG